MNKLYAMIVRAASASVSAQNQPDLKRPLVKDGKNYTY